MAGVTDLATLINSMQPVLLSEEFVFVSFPEGEYGDGGHLDPIAMVREKEGMTLVVTKSAAEENNQIVESTFRCISLEVHSSLDAVGLTAAISTRLAEGGISANVLAGFFHDHVFVPAERADEAMVLLQSLSQDRLDP